MNTEQFVGEDGHLTGLRGHEARMEGGKFVKVDGSDFEMEADLVLLAMGFVGPEREGLLTDLGVEFTDRGNVTRDASYATSVPGVFVAGDMGRGQSLIVWAIAEGRAAAAGVDRYLMGRTALPAPIKPTAVPQRTATDAKAPDSRRKRGVCVCSRDSESHLSLLPHQKHLMICAACLVQFAR